MQHNWILAFPKNTISAVEVEDVIGTKQEVEQRIAYWKQFADSGTEFTVVSSLDLPNNHRCAGCDEPVLVLGRTCSDECETMCDAMWGDAVPMDVPITWLAETRANFPDEHWLEG